MQPLWGLFLEADSISLHKFGMAKCDSPLLFHSASSSLVAGLLKLVDARAGLSTFICTRYVPSLRRTWPLPFGVWIPVRLNCSAPLLSLHVLHWRLLLVGLVSSIFSSGGN